MKNIVIAIIIALIGGYGTLPALAESTQEATSKETQNATFAIENMTCAMCPLTVKAAMSKVEGVQSVKVDFETKKALVKYNPQQTDQTTIAAASTNAGYPAQSVSGQQE